MIKALPLSNGVSWGATFVAEDTSPIDIQFVGASGYPVDYPLAIVCSNATFTLSKGVYTFTPTIEGEVHIIAQRSMELR